jgi:prophage regulatory protein
MSNNTFPNFVRLKEVMNITRDSEYKIKKGVAAGTFPKPLRLGKNSLVWLESDLSEWIQSKIDESKANAL